MAQSPLPAYKGDQPYVFVSYSHGDEDAVFGEIAWLQVQGINVWYDTTGIGPGSEWNDEIARAIQGAVRFVYFITPRSVESEHCRRELNFAQAEGRSVMAVHLEPTRVPPGLRLSLDNRQAIFKFRLDDTQYRSALVESLTTAPARTPFASTAVKPTRSLRGWFALGALAILLALGWLVLRGELAPPRGTALESPSTPTERPATEAALLAAAPPQLVDLGGTNSMQARAHYLVANELWNYVDPERALKELESAIEIDPEYAQAWILMSHVYGAISRDPAQTETALARMSTAAARAVAAAPDYWEAHTALWIYLAARRDFVGADRAFHKAVELAAAAEIVMHPIYTQYLWQFGRNRERQEFIESIRHLDPLFPTALNLYYLGRKKEAVAELQRMRGVGGADWSGDAGWSNLLDGYLAIERGDVAKLDELYFAGTDLEGLWGTAAFLDALRRELVSDTQRSRAHFAFLAIFAASHGDIDLALGFLRREYLRDGYGSLFILWHPGLANVRASEGFGTFLRDYGLVAMFQSSGQWNDYCQPVGADGFECR